MKRVMLVTGASAGIGAACARLAHMVPMKRNGTAEEVARAILWLCPDDARDVTGGC